jgi:hypothetical protein
MENLKTSAPGGFKITTSSGVEIRFEYYEADAPVTVAAFRSLLPFTLRLKHARFSGEEIWADDAPPLKIIQENASVFTNAGEVVYGPDAPLRTRTRNCIGIYYGEGKGLDAANIFAYVNVHDRKLLAELGNKIWLHGAEELTFGEI